jgi:hypothetical protein
MPLFLERKEVMGKKINRLILAGICLSWLSLIAAAQANADDNHQSYTVTFISEDDHVLVRTTALGSIVQERRLDWNRDETSRRVDKFLSGFRAPANLNKEYFKRFDPHLAKSLYTELLAKGLENVPKGSNLKIVPNLELALSIKKLYPEKTDVFTGTQASKSTLTSLFLNKYSILVFATHGYAGHDLPGIEEPVLILTLIDQPSGTDGFLRASEVRRLRLDADLVALLTSESGLGPVVPGKGIASMGNAFLEAGARSVLVTLCSVSETATV